MAVEPDLCLVADLFDDGADALLGAGQHEGAGRVDDVDALGAGVDHDPGLPRELVR